MIGVLDVMTFGRFLTPFPSSTFEYWFPDPVSPDPVSHILEKKFAQVLGLSINDIIAVPVTPLWHRGVRGGPVKVIGEGANLDRLIDDMLMQRFGVRPANATIEQIWIAHRDVYKNLDREDWAKAIYEAYIQARGIAY